MILEQNQKMDIQGKNKKNMMKTRKKKEVPIIVQKKKSQEVDSKNFEKKVSSKPLLFMQKRRTSSSDEKQDWKKLKTEHKEFIVDLKQNRRGSEVYQLSVEAKKIWEELRREDCKKQRKEELCSSLYNKIKGNVKSLIYAPDTVRVVQTLFAAADENLRSLLYEEMKNEILELSKNKYSKFFVIKMLNYGTKVQKNEIILAFKGHVVKLMRHKIACDVVELAYNDYANVNQRSSMVQEFFGPQFRLFNDPELLTLEDVLKKHSVIKNRILQDLRNNLQPILDKGVFTNTMIHTLIKEFLLHCSDADRNSVIDSLKEALLPIIHTRDGARVAMHCIWYGSRKDRKTILKSFKEHYIEIACGKYSYLVLLAIFDCFDDTVFVKKVVLDEIMKSIEKLIESQIGFRVLKYIVAPRSKIFFHPDILSVLTAGDNNPTSKKDGESRKKEIQASTSDPILALIESNIEIWALDSHFTLFVGAALKVLSGPKLESTFIKLSEMCSKSCIVNTEKHLLENAFSCKMLSYIIKHDHVRHEAKLPVFSKCLLDSAEHEITSWLLSNRGCFLLVDMIETTIPDVVNLIKDRVNPLKRKLAQKEYVGAKILLEKLE